MTTLAHCAQVVISGITNIVVEMRNSQNYPTASIRVRLILSRGAPTAMPAAFAATLALHSRTFKDASTNCFPVLWVV